MVSEKARKLAETEAPPAICGRLEHVRRYFGFDSLRSFWKALCDGWDEEDAVSYEAARKYHDKREPPVRYVRRISEVFEVRLEWLIAERGEMTRVEDPTARGREELWSEIKEAHPEVVYLSAGSRDLFLSTLLKWAVSAPDVESLHDPETREQVVEIAGDLLFLLRLPLKLGSHGFRNIGTAPPEAVEGFNLAMLAALRGLMAPPHEGVPLRLYRKSLIRDARKRVEELEVPRAEERQKIREQMPDVTISRLEED